VPLILYSLFLLLTSSILTAQTDDSLLIFNFKDISVEAKKVLESKVISNISQREINRSDSYSLSEIAAIIPSLKVQTNSRGEALFSLRGAGERQITILYDDIPLNIPWDNRIDLSLIPAESIGEINLIKGVPSVTLGANSVGGVVSIKSLSNKSKPFRKLSLQKGYYNNYRASATFFEKLNNFTLFLNGSYNNITAFPLPGNLSDSPLYPGNSRENSFLQSLNLMAKGSYTLANNSFDLTAAFTSSSKGVPPESHITSPRFWKYPLWQRFHLQSNGVLYIPTPLPSSFHYSVAYTTLTSEITQYSSSSYQTISDVEKGDDLILNGKILYSRFLTTSSLIKGALVLTSSTHKEYILSDNYSGKTYKQNLISGGVEYDKYFNNLTAVVGVGYDISTTPEAGEQPASPHSSGLSATTGLVYFLSPDYSLHFSAGRKIRFPTLREAYSGALGRFIPNPSLQPEKVSSAELSLNSRSDNYNLNAGFFFSYLNDGIVRVTLPERKFQRINKSVIRNYGLEFTSNYNFINSLDLNFSLTYINSKGKSLIGDFTDTLEYVPNLISSLSLNYTYNRAAALIEFNYTSGEYGLAEGINYFIPIPDKIIINLRTSYHLRFTDYLILESFVRINNFLDKEHYSQLGLPEPGRQIWFGIDFRF
jgi:iron complex outermembrane recepter protein